MKTLPKLSEYVKLLLEKYSTDLKYDAVDFKKDTESFTNFITQLLNLSYFVPAIEKDGKWIVLEEPKGFECCAGILNDCDCRVELQYNDEEIQEYQTALDNVVFKGFEVQKNITNPFSDYGYSIRLIDIDFNAMWKNNITNEWELSKGINTIEDIIPYNLEVNETIIKKFGL